MAHPMPTTFNPVEQYIIPMQRVPSGPTNGKIDGSPKANAGDEEGDDGDAQGKRRRVQRACDVSDRKERKDTATTARSN